MARRGMRQRLINTKDCKDARAHQESHGNQDYAMEVAMAINYSP